MDIINNNGIKFSWSMCSNIKPKFNQDTSGTEKSLLREAEHVLFPMALETTQSHLREKNYEVFSKCSTKLGVAINDHHRWSMASHQWCPPAINGWFAWTHPS